MLYRDMVLLYRDQVMLYREWVMFLCDGVMFLIDCVMLYSDFTMLRTPLDFSLCSRIKYRPNINKTCFKSCRFSPCLIIGEKIVKLLKM